MNQMDANAFRRLMEHAASEAMTRAQDFHIPHHIPADFQRHAHDVVEDAFIGIVPFLKKVFVVLFTGLTLLVSSNVTYGLFYMMVMPNHRAAEPLYFDYTKISSHPAPICVEYPLEKTCQKVDMHEGAPWAVANLFSKQTQWENFSSDVVPRPRTESRMLKESSAHFIEIILDLPESELNREIGMFGVLVDLQASNGTLLASSMRAARFPHESLWISTVRKIMWLVPLVIGAVQETRRIVVPSFRYFVESEDFPLQFVTVRLIMQNKAIHDAVEVTRGEILIGEELNVFQYLLKDWFFTCYTIGTSVIFFAHLFGVLILRWVLDERARRRLEEDPSLNLNLDEGQLSPEQNFSESTEWEDLPQQPADSPTAEEAVSSPSPHEIPLETPHPNLEHNAPPVSTDGHTGPGEL